MQILMRIQRMQFRGNLTVLEGLMRVSQHSTNFDDRYIDRYR